MIGANNLIDQQIWTFVSIACVALSEIKCSNLGEYKIWKKRSGWAKIEVRGADTCMGSSQGRKC